MRRSPQPPPPADAGAVEPAPPASPSDATAAAAAEWEGMYTEGKTPYSPQTLPSVLALIRKHLPPHPHTLVDVGAGYGRFARSCAELGLGRRIVAVEPTASGCARLAELRDSLSGAGGVAVEVARETAQGFGWAAAFPRDAARADLVLFDSVLSFVPEPDRLFERGDQRIKN